nr:nickel-binding protein [Sinomonas mesophila]
MARPAGRAGRSIREPRGSDSSRRCLRDAHDADVAIQDDEKVNFKIAWADPESGDVFCLSEAPSADAVRKIHERTGHPVDEIHPLPLSVS